MREDQDLSAGLSRVVTSAEEFDHLTAQALPHLLDRTTAQTRRFLRETGQWADDIAHEKLALRRGYELLERFLVCGRAEVPCRPLFILDSLVAKHFSQPEPLWYEHGLLSPLGRFIEGLTSRAVVSRDALMTLFYHLYGLGQGQVVRVLGIGSAEGQRVYKNFERWRRGGWRRAVEEIGITDAELLQIEHEKTHYPNRVNAEADRVNRLVQAHYRKSEPEHYPCLTRRQWQELYEQDYGFDYRVWYLSLCHDCLMEVFNLRQHCLNGTVAPQVDLRVRPLVNGRIIPFGLSPRGGNDGTGRSAQRISTTPA